MLARHSGNQIEIDLDAAGHGWFVDPTPGDNSEFNAYGEALPGSDAEGNIDLLTAISHELGHVVGFDHDSMPLMADSLSASIRIEAGSEAALKKAAWVAQRDTLVFHESLDGFLSAADSRTARVSGLDSMFDDWFTSSDRGDYGTTGLSAAFLNAQDQASGDSRIYATAEEASDSQSSALTFDADVKARSATNPGAGAAAKAESSGLINWTNKSGLVSRLLKLR